jgi:hypothetical protein
MALYPVQAVALYEFWAYGGLFASMSVSAGKTLLSLLLALIGRARRPVLMVPAKLVHKTKHDFCELSKHWQVGAIPEILSYESLGPKTGKHLLDTIQPDVLILDEGHKVRNPRASRTRKIRHYLQAHPETRVCVLSGTTIKRALADYEHLIFWALRHNSPIPHRPDVLEEWDNCLGEKLSLGISRLSPGALMKWCDSDDITQFGLLNAARRGVQRRLAETPGVVCYHVAADDIGADIDINGLVLPCGPAIDAAFRDLRPHKRPDGTAAGWVLPDGHELVEGCEVYRAARQLSRGFFLRWKEQPPKPWLEKRKQYNSNIRQRLTGSRLYDSPDEVADAHKNEYWVREWKAIRDSYHPETTIVWIDGGPLQVYRDWLRGGGIVFCMTVAFGEALAQVAKVPYFGAGGVDSRGRSIDTYAGKACVASFKANFEGRNLQLKDGRGFERLCLAEMPESGPEFEQGIGRLHRRGTEASLVDVTVGVGCVEDLQAFWQSVRDAELHKHGDGGDPKLLLADIDVMTDDETPEGARWRKSY